MTSGRPEAAPHQRGGKSGIRIAAVVLLLGAAIILYDAISISERGGLAPGEPGFFPMAVGVGLVVVSLLFLLRTTLMQDKALFVYAAEEQSETHWNTVWLVIAALVAYAFVLQPVGYIVSTSLFFVGIAWVAGSRRWIRDIIVAVLFSAAIYFGFTELLGVRLPAGILQGVL
ncbi:tripartite tricarboxylate transporter TctB family protein [Crystallibacter degradans]|uniref:tripartite tricarboxylate transporter TctB family protein n=1 Tax=Crystallibacter degradans TaxID=2726743 RepID=UPI0014764494|nr:tripartite tricarboxylate transporter TctB family protein [Arthrobacter sp. SF27]